MKSFHRKGSKRIRFAICVAGNHLHLEARKVYRILPDPVAEKYNYIRVVDDSQEDYVYPLDQFVFIDLPKKIQRLIPDAASVVPQKRKSARRVTKVRRRASRQRQPMKH